jgi:hypothetical protein
MAALLLAGTTSFVSCKDNVDDVENGIRKDMETLRSGLQTTLDGLETRVGILEANQVNVDDLNKAINDLRAEIQTKLNDKADKKDVDKAVNDLKAEIARLEGEIKKLSKTMVTGVVIQETLDCVVGTINLPGFKPAFLAAYVGENKTGMPEFPISGKDYNVDPDGNYLLASELPQDANGNWDEDAIIGNSGKNAYLINGTGNAGKLYFTINPRKVDPTLLHVDLINSRGEETGITLDNIQKSDHLITFAIGKNGNGMTRADGDAANDILTAPTPTNVENDKTYLYEAQATVALDAIEKMHFDYTKFGYQNKWDAGAALLGVNQGPDAEAQNLFGRFQYLAKQVKAKNIKNVLEGSLKILQDFYNGVYSQRNKLQKSAVRVSWDDGENDVISGFDITTVTINPLNYKQMILADQLLSGASWNITPLSPYVNKILKAIQAKLPNVSPISINLFPNGTTIVVKNATAINATATVGGTPGTATIPAGTTLATIDLGDYINTAAITSLENQVNALLKPYNKVKNATANGVMNRVNNYLNNVTAKIMAEFENQPCWKLTEPTLLFESREGINRMYPFSDADGSYTFEAGKYTFIMTSMTEEYIVPVYRKYIALIYGGKVKQYYSLAGNEKIVQLDIPNEACEIVYQTSDYYGNVVTKRYPINRK